MPAPDKSHDLDHIVVVDRSAPTPPTCDTVLNPPRSRSGSRSARLAPCVLRLRCSNVGALQ
jgi:hypothetical protein